MSLSLAPLHNCIFIYAGAPYRESEECEARCGFSVTGARVWCGWVGFEDWVVFKPLSHNGKRMCLLCCCLFWSAQCMHRSLDLLVVLLVVLHLCWSAQCMHRSLDLLVLLQLSVCRFFRAGT